eukprot:scaffold3665_cov244-Pinguiococcus_pyrenoidosus.AAC.5
MLGGAPQGAGSRCASLCKTDLPQNAAFKRDADGHRCCGPAAAAKRLLPGSILKRSPPDAHLWPPRRFGTSTGEH